MTPRDDSPRPGADARYLSTPALAEYLAVSTRTVVRWRESLTGPPFVRVGAVVRYSPTDVKKWLSAATVTPLTLAA